MREGISSVEAFAERKQSINALAKKQRRINELEKLMQRGNPAQREQAHKKLIRFLRGEEEEKKQ